jgi:hypothetical protein
VRAQRKLPRFVGRGKSTSRRWAVVQRTVRHDPIALMIHSDTAGKSPPRSARIAFREPGNKGTKERRTLCSVVALSRPGDARMAILYHVAARLINSVCKHQRGWRKLSPVEGISLPHGKGARRISNAPAQGQIDVPLRFILGESRTT